MGNASPKSMIAGIFHQGSGLGNQLHRYVVTRVLAEDKGYGFGMINPENFKGQSFMSLDMGQSVDPTVSYDVFEEKKIMENGVDIRGYDPEINFVKDGTVLDGEFQDPRYFEHRLKDIDKWLHVEPLEVPDDTCLIGFRGGEYALFPDLFLPKNYWHKAVEIMWTKHGIKRFEVHTDDPKMALDFFTDMGEMLPVGFQLRVIDNTQLSHSNHTNMGFNWRSMRYAKNAIIANSSFYILPRLFKKGYTIAPKWWAGHNKGFWQLPQNYYKGFFYL